jgi:hypothetical protein
MRNLINRGVMCSIIAVLLFVGYHSILTMYFFLFSASGVFGIICATITNIFCFAILVLAGALTKAIIFTKSKI